MSDPIIFHVDFDYFYAQCEEIRDPLLKTKPVVVCAFSDRGADSGAVATANYTSREYGVKSGMPISLAKKKLLERDDSVFLHTDFDYYANITNQSMKLMEEFADIFEYVGRDEAYLDVTQRLDGNFDKSGHFAQQLKNKIRDVVHLTCSVGISTNKLISKIASAYNKPDGLTVVRPNQILTFLEPLNIRDIPHVGSHTYQILSDMGVETVGQAREIDIFDLQQKFGRKIGTYIFHSVRGYSTSPVSEKAPNVQYSKIHTLKQDSLDYDYLYQVVQSICSEIHEIITKNNKMFHTIGLQFVQSDLTSKSKSYTTKTFISSKTELEKITNQLLIYVLNTQQIPFRRIGVRVSDLSDIQGQTNLSTYF